MRIGAYWSVLSVFKRIGAYSCLFLHCNNMQEYPRIRKNMREYARIRSIHSNVHKNTQESHEVWSIILGVCYPPTPSTNHIGL